MTSTSSIVLQGSARQPLAQAQSLGPIDPAQRIEVTVRLRAAAAPPAAALTAATAPLATRQYLSRDAFAAQHGASTADIALVASFAQAHGLVLVASHPEQRSVVLSGTAAALSTAFDTALEEYEHPDGSYRGRVGHLALPPELDGVVEGVFGLDDRPQAAPRFQFRQPPPAVPARLAQSQSLSQSLLQAESPTQSQSQSQQMADVPPLATDGAFTPPELARLYNFPTGLDGTGQCIGIIELGGGSRPADIKAYFAKLGLPAPKVKSISVDHAKNSPSVANSADAEVMLDIEVAGAIAPKALIAVYYAPNTDRGFLDAITQAVHDKTNKPSVITISWGAAEVNWTEQAMTAFEQVFADAAVLGVSICCASGDTGSADGETDGSRNVDFPASAPHALGCGGTKLVTGAGGASTETVWNEGADSATGGGFSKFFSVPDYQAALAEQGGGDIGSASTGAMSFTGRGVPDVSGDADPASGYIVRVDGAEYVIGGTSAVAPLWAGLIALMNQQLAQPGGFLNPLLYGALHGQAVTRDITVGDNGAFPVQAGWDACTGWGSPDGAALLRALAGA